MLHWSSDVHLPLPTRSPPPKSLRNAKRTEQRVNTTKLLLAKNKYGHCIKNNRKGQLLIPLRPKRLKNDWGQATGKQYFLFPASISSTVGKPSMKCSGGNCETACFTIVGLAEQRFFIALVFDLMDKHVLGPAELSRHADVELSFERVSTALEND